MEGDINVSEFNDDDDEFANEEIDEEMELEMLTEECEELINRLSTCAGMSVLTD